MESTQATVQRVNLTDYVQPIPRHDLSDDRKHRLWRYFLTNNQAFFPQTDKEKGPEKLHGNRRYFTTFAGGANFYAPPTDREKILDLMAQDVENGTEFMFYNQFAYEDEGYRFVVDVDAETVLTSEEQRLLIVTLEQTLSEFYTAYVQVPIPVFVACCGPRLKKDALSLSMHLIAHVTVTFEQATQLLYSYKSRLARVVGLRMEQIEIDAGVYKENAGYLTLRPIYNHKQDDCPVCKGKPADKLGCKLCDQKGKVCSKLTYVPTAYACGSGPVSQDEFLKVHSSWGQIMRDYSVWSLDATERRNDYALPAREPAYQVEEKRLTKTGKPRKNQTAAGAAPRAAKTLPADNIGYNMLENYLHHICYKGRYPWAGIEVSSIAVKGNTAFVNVRDTGSTTCLYAEKDHHSSRIHFSIHRLKTTDNLTHHCHCSKEQYGCQNKPRISFNISTALIRQVFGEEDMPNFVGKPRKRSFGQSSFDLSTFMQQRRDDPEETDRHRKLQKLAERKKQEAIEATAQFYKLR